MKDEKQYRMPIFSWENQNNQVKLELIACPKVSFSV
jgi:hypothetical protein